MIAVSIISALVVLASAWLVYEQVLYWRRRND